MPKRKQTRWMLFGQSDSPTDKRGWQLLGAYKKRSTASTAAGFASSFDASDSNITTKIKRARW